MDRGLNSCVSEKCIQVFWQKKEPVFKVFDAIYYM
jgi:hypothetical protein